MNKYFKGVLAFLLVFSFFWSIVFFLSPLAAAVTGFAIFFIMLWLTKKLGKGWLKDLYQNFGLYTGYGFATTNAKTSDKAEKWIKKMQELEAYGKQMQKKGKDQLKESFKK